MDDIRIRVEAEINPTEDLEKVETAVANILGSVPTRTVPSDIGSLLIAEDEGRGSLENFRNLLRRDRVRDAARKILLSRQRGNTITFFLNKQVAFAGHVSFSQEIAESPLGPIKITVVCENPRELIDWLTSRTP
jgi:predicted RNA binding protein with dsRBD fold (UPF0201 family)